jgi:hypothetical protein
MPAKHIVEQGESIASIAYENGLFPDYVWNHPDNKDLKELRKDPYVLLPGDVVVVPERRQKVVEKPTGQRHVFRRKGVPEKLVVNFMYGDDPRANETYVLEIDGKETRGTTDRNGKVEVYLPPNAKRGKITFLEEGDEFELCMGHLDPVTEVAGVQGRLHNLGLYDGPVDGEMNPELEEAIRIFQERSGLACTGKLDDSVRNWLKRSHGS